MTSPEEAPTTAGGWLLAGASGFLGTSLAADLRAAGIGVRRLVRSEPSGPDESRWDPAHGDLDPAVFEGVSVVVNVAGVSVQKRWTDTNRRAILDSRVQTTRTLAEALASRATSTESPAPAFLAGSATGGYPKNTGRRLSEADTAPAPGFLGEVVSAWESAADPARNAGIRVAHLRTGVVLDRSGGAFPLLSLPFKAGLGVPLGDGSQVMPVIGLTDWLAAVRYIADNPTIVGPVNLVIPERVTNRAFTDALAAALRRPRVPAVRVPAAPMRLALDGFATELLDSVEIDPAVLLGAGFEFVNPTLTGTLSAALARP